LFETIRALRANQSEPRGEPLDRALEASLCRSASRILHELEPALRSRALQAVARLRREWFSSVDPARRAAIDREVAAIQAAAPADQLVMFDVGYLCNRSSLERQSSRQHGKRYSAWLLALDAAGDRLMSALPSTGELNARLPAMGLPEGPRPSGVVAPVAYRVVRTKRLAGEAAVGGHVANFMPEDSGTSPKGRVNWTVIYRDALARRYASCGLPLVRRLASPHIVSRLYGLPQDEVERHLICVLRGHELGHFSGPTPLRLAGYPGLDGPLYPIVEELRADATWLFASSLATDAVPSNLWHDHIVVFLGEAMAYVHRGLARADSVSNLVLLTALMQRRALYSDECGRLIVGFDRLIRAAEAVMIEATHLIASGDSSAVIDYLRQHNFDYGQRRLVRSDPVIQQLIAERVAPPAI
jgi:hypothetical protein